MDNILKFKDGKLSKPHKLKLTNHKSAPSVETTIAENIVIQKFIKFALKDLEFQLELFKKSKLIPSDLEEKTQATTFLMEYYKITLYEIEKGIY